MKCIKIDVRGEQKECLYLKVNKDKSIDCTCPITRMEQECLIRHLVWDRIVMREVQKKQLEFIESYKKLIDKMQEDMDDGEEWKRGLDDD